MGKRAREIECRHETAHMVAYVASMASPHASAKWCPDCGALGWTDYDHTATIWSFPRTVMKARAAAALAPTLRPPRRTRKA